MKDLILVAHDGATRFSEIVEPKPREPVHLPLKSRVSFAAAHVVPQAWGDNVPGAPADIDWDSTLAFRHHVWSCGLGVADAMDTAQRNMGLDARATRELISRSSREAASVGGALVVGVNTDHVDDVTLTLPEIVAAYRQQLEFAQSAGARVVLMASRHLSIGARSARDYERVYREVLASADEPVILHWLGPGFDPQLKGYFGSEDIAVASDTLLRIVEENLESVCGIKMSLLDPVAEVSLRTRLPDSVRMFTGDDFNYVDLIEGGTDQRESHSDALLGAFAAFPALAAAALGRLDAGDRNGYRALLGPTEALSRKIFSAPTYRYKVGVAFLSWLNGHQPAFAMVGGLQSARSVPHLSEIVELANRAGALENPDLAVRRWNSYVALLGIKS